MEKCFSINRAGHSIRCLLYCAEKTDIERVVIYCHGFGGHKENGAARRFAEFVLSKYKRLAVLCFDLPCHGEDACKKLRLDDCGAYLGLVIDHARETLGARELYLYATSFGGYLALKYISEHGSPFVRAAFRSPAVNMYEVLTRCIMTEENRSLLARGKDALAGFDRKIKISPAFLQELREADITVRNYWDWAEDMLIVHGTKDEIVPIEAVRQFADDNLIEFVPVENADHRFIDPNKSTESLLHITRFLAL